MSVQVGKLVAAKLSVRVPLLLVIAFTASTSQASSDVYPNSCRNNWAYAALSDMRAVGHLEFYDGPDFRSFTTASRRDIARAALSAFNKLWWTGRVLKRRIDLVYQCQESMPLEKLRAEMDVLRKMVDEFFTNNQRIRALTRMTKEFRSEFEYLGVDVHAMQGHLTELLVTNGGLLSRLAT